MKAIIKQLLIKIGLYKAIHSIYRSIIDAKNKYSYPSKRRSIMKNYSSKFYLNIGGGTFCQPDWRVMDYVSEQYGYNKNLIDFNINLMNKPQFPIDNETVDLIYSSHTLEHLTDDVIKHVINECYRILKPGGIFRITVPDIDPMYDAYKAKDYDFIANNANSPNKENGKSHFLGVFSSLDPSSIIEHQLNDDINSLQKEAFLNKYIEKTIDPDKHDFSAHVTWLNHNKLSEYSSSAGFSEYQISSKKNSISPQLRGYAFDHKPGIANLYADLIK